MIHVDEILLLLEESMLFCATRKRVGFLLLKYCINWSILDNVRSFQCNINTCIMLIFDITPVWNIFFYRKPCTSLSSCALSF